MLTKWFEVADRRFEDLILPNVHVDTLFSEGRWLEGPSLCACGALSSGFGHSERSCHAVEATASLCFGGPRRNRLFICATRSL
jgi:hypothetical protein